MMNRTGYTLSALPLPKAMPPWGRELTIATQAIMDAQYLHGPGGLDNYYDQADSWIQTQLMLRTNSNAPKEYQPDKFAMKIPARQIVDYDPFGTMTPFYAEPDPNIHPPALPAYIDPGPPGGPGFKSSAPSPEQSAANANAQVQIMAAVMAKLVAIEQRLIAMAGK